MHCNAKHDKKDPQLEARRKISLMTVTSRGKSKKTIVMVFDKLFTGSLEA